MTELDDIPRELRGLHPANPVNLPRHGGVQLELPPRVRGLGPKWAHWSSPEPVPPMAALIDALAPVARRLVRPIVYVRIVVAHATRIRT